MVIFYLDDELFCRMIDIKADIANLEAFERELDESYPNGWSYDPADLEGEE